MNRPTPGSAPAPDCPPNEDGPPSLPAQSARRPHARPGCCPARSPPSRPVPAPDSVAEHDLVSEVYHIISGSGTLMLGPEITNMKRRPATQETVRLFNGPGNNGSAIRNGKAYNLKAGDVVIIPAGTGHQFTKIDDHITYIMIRIDPDKVTPTKDEAASQAYLKEPPRPQSGQPRE